MSTLTVTVNEENLARVQSVQGDQVPDKDLVGRVPLDDLELERQWVTDLGR